MHPADIRGFRQVGHSDLGGFGDGMQVMRSGDALYVGHFGPSKMGTSILDVSDVANPRLVHQMRAPEGGHTHKVQVADGLLLTNHEAFRGGMPERVGLAVYDLSDPHLPREVGFWNSTGKGVHRIVYEGGPYAYVSATPDGFEERIWVVVDVSDPEHPVERARWWWPGMKQGETRTWPESESRSVHHAMVHGDRAYLGFWDSNMVILDISDLDDIGVVSHLQWEVGGHTHTCLPMPGRDIVVVTDEAISNECEGDPHMVRVVDVSDETSPEVVAICPPPEGDFCERGLRFGAHCLHENRPGSYRSAEVVFTTYFNGGLRVYDLADPLDPRDIAHWIPECPPGQAACQINDVWVAEDLLVYVTDRVNGGVYILEPEEALAARLREARI
ncbi:MAG TPA: hypothetical protein VIY70_06875 [Acidimicrobiia bacterium]